jgi:O-antigen/teichoic acid export membrane protein
VSFWNKIRQIFPWFAVRNISLIGGSSFITHVTGLFYSIVVVRTLGGFEYGQLLIVISASTVITDLLFLKLPVTLNHLLSSFLDDKDHDAIDESYTASLFIQLTSSFVGYGLLFLGWRIEGAINLVEANWFTYIFIFYSSLVLREFRRIHFKLFQSHQLFGNFGFIKGASNTILDFLPLLFLSYGIKGICAGYLLAEIINFFLVFILMYPPFSEQKLYVPKLKTDWSSISNVFSRAKTYYFSKVSSQLGQNAGNLLIGKLGGARSLSYFNIGNKFFKLSFNLFPSVKNYLFPRMIQKWKNNRDEFYYTLQKYLRLSTLFVVVFGIFLVAVVPFLLPLLYGEEFLPALWVFFIILPFRYLAKPTASIFREVCFATEQVNLYRNLQIIGNVIFILALPAFISVYSFRGAAIAKALHFLFSALYTFYYIYRLDSEK